MNSREKEKQQLLETMDRISISLSDKMCDQLLTFYDLLTETNKVMNLTAITEFTDVLEKHFLDSLSLVHAVSPEGKKILDLGTGAGFPGIPIKIVFPDTEMVLADSLQKRIRFLDNVIEQCGLEKIRAVHGRAEDLGRNKEEYREQFDMCVSRAVANLSSLSEYCIPFVKKGGCFAAYKSGEIREELSSAQKAIRILGGEVENVCSFTLPGTDLGRTIVVIRKVRSTPGLYPRKAGMPGKQPL